jgi:Luciferase-like monooxygenase
MNPIKFGLVLPYGSARIAAKLSQMAEEANWDGCFLGDAIWCEDPMIALAAAAAVTSRIRLGTMVIPVPIRRPWQLASESLALDHLSEGRLILGLGAGAVWMGWQAFPDEVTDKRARAEMLDETIDILTRMHQSEQFDYDGKHFHVKLTLMDTMHYPAKSVQQPRIPIWVPGLWPRKKSMARVLKCDGILVEKMSPEGQHVDVTPDDIREIKAYVEANRALTTPFDIVYSGQSGGLDRLQLHEKLMPWIEAGITWWVEHFYGVPEEQVSERIRQGPPAF